MENDLSGVTQSLQVTKREIKAGNDWYQMRVRPYVTEEKRIDGVVLTIIDISSLKKSEEALRESENKLQDYATNLEGLVKERTKQLKDAERLVTIGQTAAMVGHDLRNPLQAIMNDVYLVKSELSGELDKAKENVKENIDDIEKNAEYINKIVADLQDYTRPLTPEAKETEIDLLCKEVFKNSIPKNINVSCNITENAKKIMSDPELVKRILSNLVSNAVQAMPKGGNLEVRAYQKEDEFVLTVLDTGEGIPDKVKPKLFQPLFTTKSKGQGFGLIVVKRITEALGGTVSFESEIGKGTTFTVRLPAQRVNGKGILGS